MKAEKLSEKPREKAKNPVKSIYYQGQEWVSCEQAEKLLGISSVAINKRAKQGKLIAKYFDQKEEPVKSSTNHTRGGSWKRLFIAHSSLPPEAQERYREDQKTEIIQRVAPAEAPDASILDTYPPEVAAEAIERLQRNQKVMAAPKSQRKEIAKRLGSSYPSEMRLSAKRQEKGIEAFIDRRHLHGSDLTPEVKKAGFTLYANKTKPSIQQAHKALKVWCKEQEVLSPSYSSYYRFIKFIPPAAIALEREGSQHVKKNFIPPVLRLPNDLETMEVLMADASTIDCFCLHSRYKNPMRPCIVAWMDVRSRMILGHIVAPTVSTNTVALAFRDAALRFGLPRAIYLDNGREFKNKNWNGQVVNYGGLEATRIKGRWEKLNIEVLFAWPYSPQLKGEIERWFSTLSHSFLNILPGYSGGNITAKTLQRDPERLKREIRGGKLFSFNDLQQIVAEAVNAYNYRPHRALSGKSPTQIYEAGYRQPRMVRERTLDFCLSKCVVKTIKSGGITVRETGLTYTGQGHNFICNIGRPGVLRFDPRDVAKAHLSAIINGREVYCCVLAPREGVAFRATEDELKEVVNRKRRDRKIIAEAAHLLKNKKIDTSHYLRSASFAIDPEREETFARAIAERQAGSNIIPFVSGLPPREEEGHKGMVEQGGLFGDNYWVHEADVNEG